VPEAEREVVARAEAGAAGRRGPVGAVECVSRGEVLCLPEVTATLFRRVGELARESSPAPIEDAQTARELEVCA